MTIVGYNKGPLVQNHEERYAPLHTVKWCYINDVCKYETNNCNCEKQPSD